MCLNRKWLTEEETDCISFKQCFRWKTFGRATVKRTVEDQWPLQLTMCVCVYIGVCFASLMYSTSSGFNRNKNTGIRPANQLYRYTANGGLSSSIFSYHPWMEIKAERPVEGEKGAATRHANNTLNNLHKHLIWWLTHVTQVNAARGSTRGSKFKRWGEWVRVKEWVSEGGRMSKQENERERGG